MASLFIALGRSSCSSLWTSLSVLTSVCACDAYTCLDLANCASVPTDGGATRDAATLDAATHDSLRSDVARSGTDISTATAEGQPGVDSSLTDTQSRNPSDVGLTPGNTSPRDAGPGELQLDGGAAPGYSESGSASEVSRDSGGDVTTPTTAFSSDTLVALDAGDATSARVAPECDDGSFWDANLSTCRNWTTCDAGTSVSAGGTQLSDRQCAPCATDTFFFEAKRRGMFAM